MEPEKANGSGMVVSDESKQSFFEQFAKVIVPLVATIGVFFQQKQRTVALSLIALAIISLLIGELPKLRARLKKRTARKDEEKAAALALDELKNWIHKFLEFTTMQTSDAFYGIVWSRLCQSNTAHFDSLHIPLLQLFADFSRILATRTDERKPSHEILKESIEEFNSPVGLKAALCHGGNSVAQL